MLDEQNQTKKLKITKNPRDTKTGRAVTSTLLEQLKEKEDEKSREEQAKREAQIAAFDKKVAARVRQQEAGAALVASHQNGDETWKNQPVDMLKAAYKCMTGKEVKDIPTASGTVKKHDVIEAIQVHLQQYPPPHDDTGMAQLESPQPVEELIMSPEQRTLPDIPQSPLALNATQLNIVEESESARPRRGVKRPRKFVD